MADLSAPEPMSPFGAFRFDVTFHEQRLNASSSPGSAVALCKGSFSECSGLEASMEPKVINEGGRNYGSHQRIGRASFGTVVLKRGLTSNRDLWQWFELVTRGASSYRLAATVTVLGPEAGKGGQRASLRWRLSHCLPTKFKVPTFNATSSDVAVEELHLAHEGFRLLKDGE